MVPEGWIKAPLKSLVEIKHGFAFKSENFSDRGHHILMTPGHFHEKGGFRPQGSKTKHYVGEIPKGYILSKGDVVVAMTEQAAGLLGSAAFVPDDGKYLHNQRLGLVKAVDESVTDINFIYWLYNSKEVRKQISEQASGTKVKHTSPERLVSVVALLPPILEQKKICEILSVWDKAITTTEELLRNSKDQKQALTQKLLTGAIRHPEFNSDWKTLKISELFSRVTTKNNKTSTNVLTISAQLGLIRQQDFFNKTVASEILDNYYLLKKGQFAYNKSYSHGYPMGAIKRLKNHDDGVVTTLYICFELRNKNICCSEFFEHFFEAGLLNQGLTKVANEGGRAHGLLNVKSSDFFGLEITIPCLEEQKNITKVLSAADQKINMLYQKLTCLELEKEALMQKLLSGKLRVKVEAA